jgi:predicted dehydrogenase
LRHRVAVVGRGQSGQRWFSVVRDVLPEAEILHVSERELRSDKGSQVRRFCPSIIVLAGPSTSRVEVLHFLVGLDASFLIEKPIAGSIEQAVELAALLGSSVGVVQVGYNLRFSLSLLAFKEVLREMSLGRVLSVRAETGQFLPTWRPLGDYRESVSAVSSLGGGVLLELSHEIDYLQFIFGPIQWVSAWFAQQSSLDIDVEDTAFLTFGFEQSTSGKLVAQLNLDFVRQDRTRSITAICENGTLRWDGILGLVEKYVPASEGWQTIFQESGEPSTYHSEFNYFLESIKENEPPFLTVNDGLAVLRVIEAARKSNTLDGARIILSEKADV